MRGFYLHLVSVSLDSPARDALLRPVARSSFFPPLRCSQPAAQRAVRLPLLKSANTKRSCVKTGHSSPNAFSQLLRNLVSYCAVLMGKSCRLTHTYMATYTRPASHDPYSNSSSSFHSHCQPLDSLWSRFLLVRTAVLLIWLWLTTYRYIPLDM